MLVDHDTPAEMLPAPGLAVEEGHGGWVGGLVVREEGRGGGRLRGMGGLRALGEGGGLGLTAGDREGGERKALAGKVCLVDWVGGGGGRLAAAEAVQ